MNSSSELLQNIEEDVIVGPHELPGILAIPEEATGLVLFAHGSGSSRFSKRNQYVAQVLNDAGIATLLFDLLSEEESRDRRKVFDIDLLAERLSEASAWTRQHAQISHLSRAYFGASTGAAAALVSAARHPEGIDAVVSRGGRPDLASDDLPDVAAATLLLVGGHDEPVIEMNEKAFQLLHCEKHLEIIPGATHLFQEPGALEEVARLACHWFEDHLGSSPPQTKPQGTRHSSSSNNPGKIYRNREEAAHELVEELRQLELLDPVVMAIPRGGAVTGAVLAKELGADLDVNLSRKLRAPFQPELAIGAISEDGEIHLDKHAQAAKGISSEDLESERQHQLKEIERRQKLFREARPQTSIRDRSVIVTDDGIATGSTMIAALNIIRRQQPRELIVAVPVAPPERLMPIEERCDHLICLQTPESFMAVGQFYEDFEQVSDEQAVDLLQQFAPRES